MCHGIQIMPNECMQHWMSFDSVHDMIQRQLPLEFMFLNNFKPSKNAHDGYESGSEDDTQKMEFWDIVC